MNDLSATTIAALGVVGSAFIAAFFAGVVSVITAWRTLANNVASINGHVNSEKTAAEGRERAKDKEIALLREVLADKQHTAGLLAQAQAQRSRGDLHPVVEESAPVQVEVVNQPLAVVTKKP